jgi:hypothetical protein
MNVTTWNLKGKKQSPGYSESHPKRRGLLVPEFLRVEGSAYQQYGKIAIPHR